VPTSTPTPLLPSTRYRATISCWLLHNLRLCHPLPHIPCHFSSHSIFFCQDDRGSKCIQNGGKVITSFHIPTYSPFIILFNIVTFSVEIRLLNELRINEHNNSPCYKLELTDFINSCLQSVYHYHLSCSSKGNCTRSNFCPQLILHTSEWLM
jgi:hypothetical protein